LRFTRLAAGRSRHASTPADQALQTGTHASYRIAPDRARTVPLHNNVLNAAQAS
jgi:hypothetical protein